MSSEDIKSAAKDFGGAAGKNADDAVQSVKSQVSKAGSQATNALDRASDTASDLYDKAKGQIRDAAGGLPDSASDALAAGQRAYDDGSKHLSRHITKQPLEALLLAGAIGYLVGWATSRS